VVRCRISLSLAPPAAASWFLNSRLLEGAPIHFATEMARVVNDSSQMRVHGRRLTENVNDLLYLKGVNGAIINGDSLEEYNAQVSRTSSRSCTSSICVGPNFTFSFDPRSTR
jgi:hypothetical protein